MKQKSDLEIINNHRAIAYLEGIFEVLTLLNEDGGHGREFFIAELDLKQAKIEEAIQEFVGHECQIDSEKIEDFTREIENVYIGFFKIEYSNNKSIKQLFVDAIIGFSKNASKVMEIKILGEYNYGLPYKGYAVYKEHRCYFLHFGITT